MKNYAIRITQSKWFDWIVAFVLFVATLALYVRTMAPGLLDGDEGEFQINIARLGVSHTGYPLFFLLGKLFTILVPIGTMATRANLFSAFWGAVTVAAGFIFIRWLIGNCWVAIITAALFAVSRIEWSQAIIPRVYTLNAFFVILFTFLFFLWRIGKIDLTIPAFVFGLSLTNHRTMIWFAPAIAVLVLWHEHLAIFEPRRLIRLIAVLVAPLLLYGYVFWRGESDVGVEFHMKDFGEMILGGNASRWMYYGGLDWIRDRLVNLYLPLQIEQFTIIGFIAGIIGLVALVLNRTPSGWAKQLPARQALIFILLANIGNTMFCVFFNTIDVEKFLIPSYLTFLFLIAVGIAFVWDFTHYILRNTRYAIRLADVFIVFGFSAIIVLLANTNFTPNDFSGRTAAITTWEENLALPLEQNAAIVGPWETITPLEYKMYVDNERRDLERWKVITLKNQLSIAAYGSRQDEIEIKVREGKPMYFTVYPGETETLTGLLDEFRFTRVAELWRIVNLPPKATVPASKTIATFSDANGHNIELLGYSVYPSTPLRAGDFVMPTLFWRVPDYINSRLTISLRIVDLQGNLIVQRDSAPANGLRPTIGWEPNEIIQDDAGMFIPRTAASGTYKFALVIYNSETMENLKSLDGNELFVFGDFQVRP
jgi:hypothetical protein